MNIFGEETIPVDESPDTAGHEEETAVDTENEENSDEEYSDDYQDEETSEEEDDGQTEEETSSDQEHDELLAGKYKSVDDLVKGYKELQRAFTQSRQPQNQQPELPQNQQPANQVPNEDPNDPNSVFWEHFRNNPIGTLQYLVANATQQSVAPIIEERQTEVLKQNIQAVAKDYQQINSEDGMKQLFGRVNEIAQEFGNPDLARNPSQRILRMAATELFGDSKAQLYEKAKQKGREEAEASRQAKKGLAAPSTGAKKPADKPKTEEEMIADNIVAAGRAQNLFG